MKTTKTLTKIFLLSALLIQTIQTDPNFELWNKTDQPFYYSIGNPDNPSSRAINQSPIKLEPNQKTTADRNLKLKTELQIIVAKQPNKQIDAYLYTFPANKTIYIRPKNDKGIFSLGPQTGPLLGMKGKTESGYSLKDNVTAKEIDKGTLTPYVQPLLVNIPVALKDIALELFKNEAELIKHHVSSKAPTAATKKAAYDILGLPSTATRDQIKSIYNKLSLKWHPDKNAPQGRDTAAVFNIIGTAYSVLLQ
jgi:DnaJ domain